jgi:hypothetical protein
MDGIYSSDLCSGAESAVNHAGLIVGYGTSNDDIDYWIV